MAQEHFLKILSIQQVAPKVKCFRLEKPRGFTFIPGHSVMISFPERKKDTHPFSFTSTNDNPYLEFHIKRFDNLNNFTQHIHSLKPRDSLLLADMFGSIRYVGPGLLIAGGQGITPFIAILRQLKKDNAFAGNTLIHSVKSQQDLFLQDELKNLLGNNYIITFTQEYHPDYLHGRITPQLIKQYLSENKRAYVLGPDELVEEIKKFLKISQAASFDDYSSASVSDTTLFPI